MTTTQILLTGALGFASLAVMMLGAGQVHDAWLIPAYLLLTGSFYSLLKGSL